MLLPQVTQLWQFFLLRMLTGIAVGGCFPLVFSLLGDLFPASERAAMSAFIQIAVGLGIGVGQVSVLLRGGCQGVAAHQLLGVWGNGMAIMFDSTTTRRPACFL
jgi:MFS family permease